MLFVPDLVTVLTCSPTLRPALASKALEVLVI